MRVELVTRLGCHLCDEALDRLRAMGIEPVLLDVDADAELFRLFDWRVPVVIVGGEVVTEGNIDAAALSRISRRLS